MSKPATAAPGAEGSRPHHGVLSMALIIVGALLLLAGLLMVWARLNVFESEGFSERSAAALEDEAVQERLAEQLTDQVVQDRPNLGRAEPLIQGATRRVVDSPEFFALFTAATRALHEAVFKEDRNDVVLELPDALARVVAALEVAAPDLAAQIPPDVRSATVQISEKNYGTRLVKFSERVSLLAVVLPVLGLAAFGGGLWAAGSRRLAVIRIGVAVAVVAFIGLLGLQVGREVLTEHVRNPANGPAAGGIWDAFVAPLRTWLWVLGAGGLAMAAVAWLGGRSGRGP